MRAASRAALGIALGMALGLGACDGGTLRIAFQVSGGPVQACPSSSAAAGPACGDVPMLCGAVLQIRIVRPSRPEETYLPLCEVIPQDRAMDLCSIEGINLPARRLPNETLEVQVMIWPREAVKEDPATGELDCREIYGQPVSIGFGVHGFPEETVPSPALGGRAFYHPGDERTVVTLGCSDLGAVNHPACAGELELSARVSRFGDWGTPLSPPTPLIVEVGEPRYVIARGEHEWRPILALQPRPGEPRWAGSVKALDVEDSICAEVSDTSGRGIPALRCARLDPTALAARRIELDGVWLPGARLGQILAGLGLPEVPAEGLTMGVLLDAQGSPAAGYEIRTSPAAAISYLAADGRVVPGGTATTDTGLFVSRDAPYGADVRAFRGDASPRAQGVGGRVSGMVTVVVLQLGADI